MSGNKQQTSGTTSEPWKAAQPALQTGLNDAMSAYKSGIGSQPNTMSTVVPYAQQTTQGMNQTQAWANAAQPSFNQNFSRVAANANQGGLNALQQGAVANLQPLANSKPVEGTGQLNDIQKRSLAGYEGMANAPVAEGTAQFNDAQRQAYDRLNPIAAGQSMQGNPYLQDVIDRSTRDIMGASNLGASAAGRYGSGSHQGVTERNVGDMASGLRFADYNTQQGRMDSAIRDMFGMGNQANTQTEADKARQIYGMDQRTAMGNTANSQYEADMGRKLDATGSLFNAGQQQQGNINANTGAMMDAYGAAQAPSQSLMDVGGMYEDLYGRQLNDQLRIFGEQQNQPWNQIGRLNAIASGAGSMGGSGTATAQGPSRLSGALGGALGGGTMFGPLGALGGGLLGAFG